MDEDWDKNKGGRDRWIAYMKARFEQCFRVLKPGAHGLVWSLPRTSHWTAFALDDAGFDVRDRIVNIFGSGLPKRQRVSLDGWRGWGTVLKPAAEDWVLVRKRFTGTVAENVSAHGTGAINIDACRIGPGRWPANAMLEHHCECVETDEIIEVVNDKRQITEKGRRGSGFAGVGSGSSGRPEAAVYNSEEVRVWKCHDRCPVRLLDEQTAGRKTAYATKAGVSRFFYTTKASSSERSAGLDDKNPHPTVKPVALMRWLSRLVTPPAGLIIDPFAGSGTAGIAAILEGFRFHGIEKDDGYAEVAKKRIAFWEKHGERAPEIHRQMKKTGQLPLL